MKTTKNWTSYCQSADDSFELTCRLSASCPRVHCLKKTQSGCSILKQSGKLFNSLPWHRPFEATAQNIDTRFLAIHTPQMKKWFAAGILLKVLSTTETCVSSSSRRITLVMILQGSGERVSLSATAGRRNQVTRSLDKLQSLVYHSLRCPLCLVASSQFFSSRSEKGSSENRHFEVIPILSLIK